MNTEYTPEKVASLISRLKEVVDTAVIDSMIVESDRAVTPTDHDGIEAQRDDAETVRDDIIAALTAITAERDSAIAEMHARELHHFEEEKLRIEAEQRELRVSRQAIDLFRLAGEQGAAITDIRRLEPTWHRGMYGCREDMFSRSSIDAILSRIPAARAEIPGQIRLTHPDGTRKTNDEIRAEAAQRTPLQSSDVHPEPRSDTAVFGAPPVRARKEEQTDDQS